MTGLVLDAKTGKPIPGAAVTGQHAILTDQQGRFVFANLAPGNYQITAAKTGYAQAQATIKFGSRTNSNREFQPEPSYAASGSHTFAVKRSWRLRRSAMR